MDYTYWIWISENEHRSAGQWWDAPTDAWEACRAEAQATSAEFCCVVSRETADEFRPEEVYRRMVSNKAAFRSKDGRWLYA